jgi:hypothetical protein
MKRTNRSATAAQFGAMKREGNWSFRDRGVPKLELRKRGAVN